MSPSYEKRAAKALEMLRLLTGDDITSKRAKRLYEGCLRLLAEGEKDRESFPTTEIVSLPTQAEFGNRLEHLTGHIEAANEWAAEKFRNHPGLSSISIDIGAALIVQFSVVLTWNRQPLG